MITIVGAGLGGLALAQGLMRRGIEVRVLERDANALSRAQGFRITLNAQGRAALRELLPPERYARVVALEAQVGRGFAFATSPEQAILRINADAWTVCRPALRAILAEDVVIGWGARVDRLPEGELVVGADGVNSCVREWLRPNAPVPEVFDTGILSVGAHVARTAQWNERLPLNEQGSVQYLGPEGQTLFVSYCEQPDRTPTILWALSQRASHVTPSPGWHPVLLELMQHGPSERFSIRSSRIHLPKQRLAPGVTLLGDAAHAMPPQRGLGGNCAFEDARQLCGKLHDIAGYEAELFVRGKKAVAESEEAANLVHMKNPLARGLRNGVLRVVAAFSAPATQHPLARLNA
jgi:2-polyprenyl-6-methoxyphenol hydroxylase-like FAD-dependent oxidoreductase